MSIDKDDPVVVGRLRHGYVEPAQPYQLPVEPAQPYQLPAWPSQKKEPWVCPKCGKVWAPMTVGCLYCNAEKQK